MSNHPTFSTPDPELLPAQVRDLAADADAAGERAWVLRERAQAAHRKARDAEQQWPALVAAAAADPQGKAPTDRRAALAVEAQRADEMHRAAEAHARGVWRRLAAALAALPPDVLAELEPPITEAAEQYRQAVHAMTEARDALHRIIGVRSWLSAAVVGSPGYGGSVRPRLGAYRQRSAPDALPRAGRLFDVTMTEVLASLTADADTLDTLKDREQRNRERREQDAAAQAFNERYAASRA